MAEEKPAVGVAHAEGHKCKECHWLYIKYRNKACSDQGSTPEDVACDQYQKVQATLDEIKQDPTIIQINEQVKTKLSSQLDKTLLAELQNYLVFSVIIAGQEVQSVPQSFNTTDEWEILQNLSVQTQAYRDRVIDVQFKIVQIKQKLDKLWRHAEVYISTTYQTTLGTLGPKASVIKVILEPLADLYDEINTLNVQCDRITTNLTSTRLALSEIKEVALKVDAIIREKQD